MLLDEVDIFLEQRSKDNISRNGLVSGIHHTMPMEEHLLTAASVPAYLRVLQRDALPCKGEALVLIP